MAHRKAGQIVACNNIHGSWCSKASSSFKISTV